MSKWTADSSDRWHRTYRPGQTLCGRYLTVETGENDFLPEQAQSCDECFHAVLFERPIESPLRSAASMAWLKA